MIFMKCDVNLFKNEDIKFITFISIIHRQYMIYLNNYLKKEGITASHALYLAIYHTKTYPVKKKLEIILK